MTLISNAPSIRRVANLAPTSLRLAAIDIGSNSIHMIVAQADADGGVTTLWRMKEPVGLGRMSFPSRRLSEESIDRAVGVLGRFLQAAKLRQAEKIVAVATSAVREASNGGDLIERVKREHGQYVRVVSAKEEARLIYLAVRHAMTLEQPHLIIDIGGGSVEFIVGDGRKAAMLESRKLGAARMSARFVSTDPIDPEQVKSLQRHYDRELTGMFETIRKLQPVAVIGTSGTLENVAALCDGTNGEHGPVIERKRFDKMLETLLHSTSAERAQMRGLDDGRKDQIVAGALLVDEIFKRLEIEQIKLCGQALREGILLDYLSRHIPDLAIRREVPDPRRRSVLDLARRSDWHQTHSEHVTALCLKLFDQLRSIHGLSTGDRELIEYGAMLHDIGWHIGQKSHHKHSQYLIINGDLKDFTPEEVSIIANIARYHRKSMPKPSHQSYQSMSRHGQRVVDVGAALLRIADGLDRSHGSVIQSVRCRLGEKKVRCTLEARSDAELELWGARQKMGLFKKVFGRSLLIELAER